MDNKFNKVFSSFSPFNHEFSLENRLIDVFPNHFSFHPSNRSNNQDIKNHLKYLDNITIQILLDPHSVVVVSDASIKNQVATSISHIYSHDKPVIKTIHHVVRVISTEAELFTIKYSIIQVIYIFLTSIKSSLSWILYMLPRKSLIIWCTHINYNQCQSLKISESFSRMATIITSNFGTAQVIKNSIFIIQLTKKLRNSTCCLSSHINLCGTLVERLSVKVF